MLSEPFQPVAEEERPSDRNLVRSEHVLAETGDRGPAVITNGQSYFVGDEHEAPSRIENVRRMTQLVQHRCEGRECRIVGERKRIHPSSPFAGRRSTRLPGDLTGAPRRPKRAGVTAGVGRVRVP